VVVTCLGMVLQPRWRFQLHQSHGTSALKKMCNKHGDFLYNDKTRSSKTTPIKFWVTTADYSARLTKNIDMEGGVKASISNFTNGVKVEREKQSIRIVDKDFTSNYTLDESIFAGYASFNIKPGKKTSSKGPAI
jgi:hypothetical protein